MKIAISSESTLDLSKELIEQYDIKVIPLQVLLGDTEYKDGDIKSSDIFEFVKKNKILPKTSAINQVDYEEFFTEIKKDYDAIIHIALSSGVSSTCANAIATAEAMENVYVVDSKSLSTGIGLLTIFAAIKAREGKSPEEVYKLTQEQVDKVQASFVIDRLDYLHKGGRCSTIALLGANLLKIHPQIILEGGKMKVHKKYRGKMEKVVGEYCADTVAEFSDANLDMAFVTYTTASEEMIGLARAELEKKGFKNIYETRAGATITSHCGENTLGILYLKN